MYRKNKQSKRTRWPWPLNSFIGKYGISALVIKVVHLSQPPWLRITKQHLVALHTKRTPVSVYSPTFQWYAQDVYRGKHSSLSHDLLGPFFPQGKSCAVYSLPSCHTRLQRHTALPDPINGTIRTILWSYQKSEHLLLFLACNLWWVSTDIVTSILALSVNPSYRTFIERVRVVYSYWCCLSD